MESSWRKTKLEVFRGLWESTLSYWKALKTARSDYFSSLLEEHNITQVFIKYSGKINKINITGFDIPKSQQ